MSTVTLFDMLAATRRRDGAGAGGGGGGPADQMLALARQMLESSLLAIRHLHEQDLALGREGGEDLGVAVVLRRMYEEWAQSAEQVMRRVKDVARTAPGGDALAVDLERLGDEYGRVRALLSVSLESVAEARAQLARGEGMSPQEVRDALHLPPRP